MWRFLILTFLTFIIAGCSMITIDEEPAEDNRENKRAVYLEQQNDAIEGEFEEKNEKSKIQDFLEAVFQLNRAPAKHEDAEPVQYIAFGDSLTRGIGDETKMYGYSGRLAETIERWPAVKEVALDNRGKNGRRSDQLLALLQKGHYDEELSQADFMTMTLGGNDVMKVVKSDLFSLKKEMFDKELMHFSQRYRDIIAEIRVRNSEAPILLIGFYNPFSIITDEYTPFETIVNEWNDTIKQIADDDLNACFVPISDLFLTNAGMVYHTDFFHPSASGYEQMTERIIEYMKLCDIEQMSKGRIGIEE